MDFLEYPDVSSEIRGAMVTGKLKMTDSKIVFKGDKSGSKNEVDANQMEMVSWQRMAGTWGVRIFTKDGGLQRFAGFKDAVSLQFIVQFAIGSHPSRFLNKLADVMDCHSTVVIRTDVLAIHKWIASFTAICEPIYLASKKS